MSLKINNIVSDSSLNVSCITNFNNEIYSSSSIIINNGSLVIESSGLTFSDISNISNTTKYGVNSCNIQSNNINNSIGYSSILTDSNGNTAAAVIGCEPYMNNAVSGIRLTNFGKQTQITTNYIEFKDVTNNTGYYNQTEFNLNDNNNNSIMMNMSTGLTFVNNNVNNTYLSNGGISLNSFTGYPGQILTANGDTTMSWSDPPSGTLTFIDINNNITTYDKNIATITGSGSNGVNEIILDSILGNIILKNTESTVIVDISGIIFNDTINNVSVAITPIGISSTNPLNLNNVTFGLNNTHIDSGTFVTVENISTGNISYNTQFPQNYIPTTIVSQRGSIPVAISYIPIDNTAFTWFSSDNISSISWIAY